MKLQLMESLSMAVLAIALLGPLRQAGASEGGASEGPASALLDKVARQEGASVAKGIERLQASIERSRIELPPSKAHQVTPKELSRLVAVARKVHADTPSGAKTFGTFVKHTLEVRVQVEKDGGLNLVAVLLKREGGLFAVGGETTFVILPADGRIQWNAAFSEKEYRQLREEVEFWTWGDGWKGLYMGAPDF